MSILKTWEVKLVDRLTIKDFIEKWHYSKSINGCITDYCFGLYDNTILKGAMFFGRLAMCNQWKKYVDNPKDIIELRRLCCIDDTPRNTESYFIGKSLKKLFRLWEGNLVLSYADLTWGHTGIIYKASNFKLIGKTKPGRVIIYNNKIYHDKTIRTKYKGKLKPFAANIVKALATGEAYYKKTKEKFIYIYEKR